MRCYKQFVFSGLVLLTSCKTKVTVTDSNVTGAWRSINTHKSGLPPDDMIFYKRGEQLFLTTYYGHHEARLNKTGDSITLLQGCMSFLLPITLHLASGEEQDTLSMSSGGSREFIRMDSTTFVRTRQAFVDEHYRKTRLMNQKTNESDGLK